MRVPVNVVSVDGFVAQVVNLITHGYRYYFTGTVKPGKDPAAIDARMVAQYEADLPKWTRERRRRAGKANFRYLRFEEFFIVLATEGEAPGFWAEDRNRIRDIRNVPLRFDGYSISYRRGGYAKMTHHEKQVRTEQWSDFKEAVAAGRPAVAPAPARRDDRWHGHVRLNDETYAGLKAYFLNRAVHWEGGRLAQEFLALSYQPYGPVRTQYRTILRAVNRLRQRAGYQRIPLSVLPFKRRIVPVFAPRSDKESAVEEGQSGTAPLKRTRELSPLRSLAGGEGIAELSTLPDTEFRRNRVRTSLLGEALVGSL